jgi:hypothetical protein
MLLSYPIIGRGFCFVLPWLPNMDSEFVAGLGLVRLSNELSSGQSGMIEDAKVNFLLYGDERCGNKDRCRILILHLLASCCPSHNFKMEAFQNKS